MNKHEEQDASQAAALNTCRMEFQRTESRRLELENADVGLLWQRATKCEKDISGQALTFEGERKNAERRCSGHAAEQRAHGYADGQLHVLKSIEIIGAPERVKGIIFDDYYYTFQVRVGNRRVVLSRIRTHKEETSFGAALAGLRDIAMFFVTRK